MNFKYKIFAYIFNFFKLFSFNRNDVFFILDKKNSFNGNSKFIKNELSKRDKFKFYTLSKEDYSFQGVKSPINTIKKFFTLLNFFFIGSYRLSKSKYVFLNDNFFPLAYMNFNKDVTIFQLWHAPGAFKKFGISSLDDENVKILTKLSNKNLKLSVSSKNIFEFYQEAFGVNKDQIFNFGVPRIDYYFNKKYNNNENIKNIRKNLERRYPEIKGKKLVLYAPTFRENKEKNDDIVNKFDFKRFNSCLGDKFSLIFKSHPKITTPSIEGVIDLTTYSDEKELLLISDILITDYSSLMVEYALLSKPIIFYPFDLDYYLKYERGFYFDYKDVPGPIAKDTDEIIKIIKNNDFDFNLIDNFVKNNYDYLDSNSSKRIVDYVLKSEF
ncbi:CDP-glycerol glycerophosphotransferase family protein [Methanobrevibacter sp. TMH8]|uniref:CDP-glycerol glycerophosphotransferase family protein n=1 Tax=Methanobrevibacter sp. TMH8 TaxID=2848611 RepID=UPI001CCA0B9D|nr:CDP-glycerol glycerophosphotransferase family protein [Methanobrevibacter sp. TMH8]MBZ9570423.1 CDP-glycerol glycerophosphotransferase family protein [Methanobrevibacter sp. TMH8]